MAKWLAVSVVTLSMVAGCAKPGMVGHWDSIGVKPEMARDQFRFLRPDDYSGELLKATVTLDKKGDYNAEVYYVGDMDTSSGTWEFADGRLVLRDSKYGSHTYPAELSKNGKQLYLRRQIRGTDVTFSFKRAK